MFNIASLFETITAEGQRSSCTPNQRDIIMIPSEEPKYYEVLNIIGNDNPSTPFDVIARECKENGEPVSNDIVIITPYTTHFCVVGKTGTPQAEINELSLRVEATDYCKVQGHSGYRHNY